MKYKRLNNDKSVIRNNSIVTVKEMGNVVEITYNSNMNTKPHTIKLNKEEYLELKTGEVKKYSSSKDESTRADNINSARKTMNRIREIINTNVTDNSKCLWITLTYKENMTDNKRLYYDFVKFHKKFCRYCMNKNILKPEYISVAEPQARGSYHLHLIYIFKESNIYIPNDDIANLWGHGFTKTKKIEDECNVGSYLVAYLSDLDINEDIKSYFDEKDIKELTI